MSGSQGGGNSRAPSRGSPGMAGCRLTYSLQEVAVKAEVTDKVRQARKDTLEAFSADVLGLRGPQWNASVATFPGKHHTPASDQKLSNTLLPVHLAAQDMRLPHGTTHVRCAGGSAPLGASSRGSGQQALPQQQGADWSTSTALPNVNDYARQEKLLTARCTAATSPSRRRAGEPGRYVSPIRRQELIIELARRAKVAAGFDFEALADKYGDEGAVAMQQILKMPGYNREPGCKPVRGRASKADLEAVLRLPEHVVQPSPYSAHQSVSGDAGQDQLEAVVAQSLARAGLNAAGTAGDRTPFGTPTGSQGMAGSIPPTPLGAAPAVAADSGSRGEAGLGATEPPGALAPGLGDIDEEEREEPAEIGEAGGVESARGGASDVPGNVSGAEAG